MAATVPDKWSFTTYQSWQRSNLCRLPARLPQSVVPPIPSNSLQGTIPCMRIERGGEEMDGGNRA